MNASTRGARFRALARWLLITICLHGNLKDVNKRFGRLAFDSMWRVCARVCTVLMLVGVCRLLMTYVWLSIALTVAPWRQCCSTSMHVIDQCCRLVDRSSSGLSIISFYVAAHFLYFITFPWIFLSENLPSGSIFSAIGGENRFAYFAFGDLVGIHLDQFF